MREDLNLDGRNPVDLNLDDATFDDTNLVVRPYLMTGGRTHTDLPMESLLRTLVNDDQHLLDTEHRQIVELCHRPTGVAEVSALVRLPLAVSRVLIGDLVGGGWLEVCPSVSSAGEDEIGFVERLLGGLRALT